MAPKIPHLYYAFGVSWLVRTVRSLTWLEDAPHDGAWRCLHSGIGKRRQQTLLSRLGLNRRLLSWPGLNRHILSRSRLNRRPLRGPGLNRRPLLAGGHWRTGCILVDKKREKVFRGGGFITGWQLTNYKLWKWRCFFFPKTKRFP